MENENERIESGPRAEDIKCTLGGCHYSVMGGMKSSCMHIPPTSSPPGQTDEQMNVMCCDVCAGEMCSEQIGWKWMTTMMMVDGIGFSECFFDFEITEPFFCSMDMTE